MDMQYTAFANSSVMLSLYSYIIILLITDCVRLICHKQYVTKQLQTFNIHSASQISTHARRNNSVPCALALWFAKAITSQAG